jgi:methionine-gamma-lyase
MNTQAGNWQVLLGGNSNPFNAFLLMNGLKTLELRMQRHCSNAKTVAEFLDQHPAIEKVNYAGLPSHPDYYIDNKQMKHTGALMSF